MPSPLGARGRLPFLRMPNRRKTQPRRRKAGNVSLGVGVALTRAEIQTLKDRAASDLRSVAAYTLWLVSQEINGPVRRRRGVGVWGGAEGSADRAADQPRDAAGDAG